MCFISSCKNTGSESLKEMNVYLLSFLIRSSGWLRLLPLVLWGEDERSGLVLFEQKTWVEFDSTPSRPTKSLNNPMLLWKLILHWFSRSGSGYSRASIMFSPQRILCVCIYILIHAYRSMFIVLACICDHFLMWGSYLYLCIFINLTGRDSGLSSWQTQDLPIPPLELWMSFRWGSHCLSWPLKALFSWQIFV